MHTIQFWAVLLFPFFCTCAGAALVFSVGRLRGKKLQAVCLGFAAGVMLAASVWSLLLPAIEMAGHPNWLAPAAGLLLGALGLLKMEQWADRLPIGQTKGGCANMVLAITLHNLPEGMVLGLALALLGSRGEGQQLAGALALSMGIGIQNIPEGASVSLPLLQNGGGRRHSFLVGVASGMVEPVGALLAFGVSGLVRPLLPWLMGLAAGAMVCVTAQEMIPQASQQGNKGVISVVVGFALMMALDVAL